jgi:rhamnosyltransferase
MQTDDDLLISIIIPVKNGDHWLEPLFKKLTSQTLYAKSEIIVLDSGSTDRSLEIIGQYPVKLIHIPPKEFNHGETRNVGVRAARGKYVVMTVQDALPFSDEWLQHFVDGFKDDTVAGVCGRQIAPHDQDKNPVRWYRFFSPPELFYIHLNTPEDLLKLTPAGQHAKCGWDNVTASYRRDILLRHPFQRTDFAEDILWAKEMLLKGFTLGHNDHAMVFHYHHQVPEFVLPRYFSVYYFEYRLFKLKPAATESLLRYVLLTVRVLLRETSVSWKDKYKWLIFNIRYRLALGKTIRIFHRALHEGEEALTEAYKQICKIAPQAPKY